jgi:XPG N-terminal domain
MGIKQLMQIINEKASKAVKKMQLNAYSGKIIACDASMAIYQFLIATQNSTTHHLLTDESGNLTSHLIGIFYRTIQFLDNGIKPIWVFDGKPPDLKSNEINKRKVLKNQAKDNIITETKADLILNPSFTDLKQRKKGKKLSKLQLQVIQKKKYENELQEIEISAREKICAIIGGAIPEINTLDYLCYGESDEEDIGLTKELEQIVCSMENKGCSNT